MIDQSGASLDRLFRKSSKRADEVADVHFRKRFAEITNEDLQLIVDNKDAKNTKRNTSLAFNIFRDDLREKTFDTELNEYCFATNLTKHT